MDPLLFSVADAAPLLAIKETRLRELIAAGRIPVVRLGEGGLAYIRRQDLEAFVAGLRPERVGLPDHQPITNRRAPERRPTRASALKPLQPVPFSREAR